MKKIFTLVVFSLISINLMGQRIVLQRPYSNTWPRRTFVRSVPIGQDENTAYLFQYIRVEETVKPKSYTDHLYIIDKKTMNFNDIELTVSRTHIVMGGLVNNNSIIALYRHANKKGDLLSFTVATIDKQNLTVSFDEASSISTAINQHYWPDYQTAKSPDGKLLAVLTMVTGKNNQLENLHAVVVNDQGEFVWNGTISPSFNGRTFSLGDMLLDNDGTIYLPAYTCRLNGESISDVELMMNVCTENGTDSYTEACGFGTPQDLTAKILNDGNVAVAGYYTESTTNTASNSNGYFFYKFDTHSEAITDIQKFSFGDSYSEKDAWTRFANVLGNQQYAISADNIYELENGNLVLCGEHRFVKATYDPMSNSYNYQFLTKNILVSTLLPNGTSSFSMIEKQQIAGSLFDIKGDWAPLNISYSAFVLHNDMYFLFNDDPQNIPYPGKDVLFAVHIYNYKKELESVLMKLTSDQELTQKVLHDPEQLLYSILFTDDEYIYTTGVGKSNLYFTKYKIEE